MWSGVPAATSSTCPTDCPQRDERLGWTGDIAVFAPTAAYLFDVEDFLRDWLADVAAEQRAADGMVPFVVPDVLKYIESRRTSQPPESTAIWSDAAVWVPWALWQAYGDLQVLSDQYDSMTAHVRRVESLLSPTGLWDTGFPIRRLAGSDRTSRRSDQQQSRQRRRGDRLPLRDRPNSYRDLRPTWTQRGRRRISQSSRAYENCLQRSLRER